jgi:hypothetical protein
MPADLTLQALQDASPRKQPGFEEWAAGFDALRAQIAATPVPARRPPPQRPSHRRLIGVSAAATATAVAAGVLVSLTLNAAAPPSAYAAARRALAATAAAASGTITGSVSHDGSTSTLDTTRWNGDSISVTRGDQSDFGPEQALLLIDGGAYVEQADGTWLHYASESGVGPKVGPQVMFAHDDVAGSTAGQILSLATGLTQTTQPDGTTLYTGTIPSTSADPGVAPTDDLILRIITNLRSGNGALGPRRYVTPPGFHEGLQVRMIVGPDSLVRQIGLTYQEQGTGSPQSDGTYTWTVSYSDLGATPSIAPPAASTPTPPVIWSQGTPAKQPTGG